LEIAAKFREQQNQSAADRVIFFYQFDLAINSKIYLLRKSTNISPETFKFEE